MHHHNSNYVDFIHSFALNYSILLVLSPLSLLKTVFYYDVTHLKLYFRPDLIMQTWLLYLSCSKSCLTISVVWFLLLLHFLFLLNLLILYSPQQFFLISLKQESCVRLTRMSEFWWTVLNRKTKLQQYLEALNLFASRSFDGFSFRSIFFIAMYEENNK